MAEIAESVPEGIPQDVWAAADEALDLMLCNCIESSGSAEQFRIDSTEPIARAILDERERCAKVAEAMLVYADTTSAADEAIPAAIMDPNHWLAKNPELATSIRQGSPK